jgi:hypothetical protein
MNYLLLIIIQIIILIIFLFINNNLKFIDKFSNSNKICIILTTYINSKEKEKMYLERVKKWLKTGIDIYLVDSNNKGLPIVNKKYHQYLFDQSKEKYFNKNSNNSTLLEIKSLIKIINYYQLTNKYDYIYKITGKYYIKEYNNLYILPEKKYDIINQYRSHKGWNNSEIVGFHSSKIINLLNNILNMNGVFEKGLGTLKKNKNIKIKKLQPLTVVKCSYFAKRNIGDTLYKL